MKIIDGYLQIFYLSMFVNYSLNRSFSKIAYSSSKSVYEMFKNDLDWTVYKKAGIHNDDFAI